jgi:hypothetical protein
LDAFQLSFCEMVGHEGALWIPCITGDTAGESPLPVWFGRIFSL